MVRRDIRIVETGVRFSLGPQMKKYIFPIILLLVLLAFPLTSFAQEADATLQKFSVSFFQFSPNNCHFTNNQGLNLYGAAHDGYDFSCVPHTYLPIKISLPMEILETGWDHLYGNYVLAQDIAGEYRFLFAHLSRTYVKKGQITEPDKTLFLMGNSGNSSGIHLHLEIIKDGLPVQLSKELMDYYPTLYRKQEKSAQDILANAFKISPQEVQDKYLKYIDPKLYPLSWFKLFATAKYENKSMEQVLAGVKQKGWHHYSNFSYYLLKNGLTNYAKRNAELNKMRAYFNLLERERFATLRLGELLAQAAEMNFRKQNSDTYYPKKGVAGAKTKK